MGRRDMHLVFQWLKRQNVKSVLKLTVIDNAEPSHSDESIEATSRSRRALTASTFAFGTGTKSTFAAVSFQNRRPV